MLYTDFKMSEELQKAVAKLGFTEMTEIQEKALPHMMEGKDITAKAPTGTGKTCAFGIPMLSQLEIESDKTQFLVLAPTRELAQQITDDLSGLAYFMPKVKIVCLYGGQAISKQEAALKNGAQVIVATPGRLWDHKQRKNIDFSTIKCVVLDEADEMLDMGFYKDVVRILDSIKNMKQLALFSATINREVMDISWIYQKDPVEIIVRPVEQSMPKIKQYALETTGRNKLPDIASVIVGQAHKRVIIFCNTKYATEVLARQLTNLRFSVDCLHGDLSQKDRNKIMADFKEGKISVLVATDVAARGIDVEDVDAVINYDVPQNNEYYTHRIGRTARAGKEGVSYLLYTADETKRVKELLRLTRSEAEYACVNSDNQLQAL